MTRRRRSPARGLRAGAAAALLASTGMLAACSDETAPDPDTEPAAEPGVAVEQAQQTYQPLVAAVAEAVGDVSVPGRPDGDPAVVYYDGVLESCAYASQRYEFDTVFGESTAWEDVEAAAAEVLEPAGFALTDQLAIPGGYTGFDAASDDGARFEVRSKPGGPSVISLDAPVRGTCDRERSETLTPAPG